MNNLELGRFGTSSEHKPELTTKIILEFMRHGKREKGKTPEEDENPDLRLTPDGRKQADSKGQELHAQPEVSVGLGSGRVRTQETAYRVMGTEMGIEEDATLEDIEDHIRKHVPIGKKMIIDERLGFDNSGPIGEDATKAYYEKRYLPWVINESDRDALLKNDSVSTTYLRNAGNLAEITARYLDVGNNFHRIVTKDETNKYAEYGNKLERYLGTHQGVVECYVAKILELIGGNEAKEEFVKSAGAGFDELDGAHFEIINEDSRQFVKMRYPVKEGAGIRYEETEFEPGVLSQIIAERAEFERHFEAEKTGE